MTFTNRQKMNLLDAKEACLYRLMRRRSVGRALLYDAVATLCEEAMPLPPYETRKALRDATLAVGR